MKRPRICASVTDKDLDTIKAVEPFVELFEVRIDLIGSNWQDVVKYLDRPWIACNRIANEGGKWSGSEAGRIEELLKAVEIGADIVDIELEAKNLAEVVPHIKRRAECLLSFHELAETPPSDRLREIVNRQIQAGADICKLVTTAQKPEDNMAVLRLIAEFRQTRVVSFTMGPLGLASRLLCPLVGGDFAYASVERGKESASGQMTARELRQLYDRIQNEK
ncbi:type I 3-dehydroquinate dehydratase [Chloroflexota bacterium]